MLRPSVKAVSGFGAASLLGSVLMVAACSSDDTGGDDMMTPPPTGGSGGSTAPQAGTPGKATGGTPATGGAGGMPSATGGTVSGYEFNVVIDNLRFIGEGVPAGGAAPTGGAPPVAGAGAGGEPAAGAGGGGAGGTLAGGNGGGGAPAAGMAGKSSKSNIQFQQAGGGGMPAGGGGAGGATGGAAPAAGAGGTLGGAGGMPTAGGMPAGGMPAGGTGGGSSICTPVVVTDPFLTDFEKNWMVDKFKATGGLEGGLFTYPAANLKSSVTTEATISGRIADYSGFGVWLACEVDASQFQGIEFDIKGNAGPGGAVKFLVQTSPNVYDTAAGKDHDTCVPTDPAKSYETCVNPSYMIAVTPEGAHVKITWDMLGMGKPMAGVDQKQILGLQWDAIWPQPAGPVPLPAAGGMPSATGGMPAATGGMPAAGGGGSGGGDAGGAPAAGMGGTLAGGTGGASAGTAGKAMAGAGGS